MTTEFKTLMYANQYIDANRLSEGIYMTDRPFLYHMSDTIESIIECGNELEMRLGYQVRSEFYVPNLKQCQLIPIKIVI